MKYKAEIRLPTDQFAYISVWTEGTTEEIVSLHGELKTAYKAPQSEIEGIGLDKKEFNRCLDEYLTTNSLINGTELYAQMSKPQQQVFQEIKKSLKRIEAKNGREEVNYGEGNGQD